MDVIRFILALVLSYGIGAVPAGYYLVRLVSGTDVRRVATYNVGIRTLLDRVGPGVTLGTVLLDLIKGGGAVALAAVLSPASAAWAVPAVVCGHLYPVLFLLLVDTEAPRSRGSVVMFGSAAGLVYASHAPVWIAAVPVLVWAVTVALPRLWTPGWGYPSLANILAGLSVPLTYAVAGWWLHAAATVVMAVLITWRHKENVGRIMDGIEVRLGQTRPMPDSDDRLSCAFMVHAMTVEDFWQPGRFSWIGTLHRVGLASEGLLRWVGRFIRPMKVDEYTGIRATDGREVTVYILGAPLLPDQIVDNPGLAVRRARQAARLARDLGARVFGLGAYWSVVGDKGVEVQEGIDIPITNGGAYTSGTVKLGVERALALLEKRGLKPGDITAAVVGANGVVGLGIARSIADRVGRLIMIGRDPERLERSRKLVNRRYKNTEVVGGTSYKLLPQADIIFTATSSPEAVIFPEHVKPGAVIFDIGRPPDVSPQVAEEVPGVRVIPGGVVRPPGQLHTNVDVHFGEGLVPACLAETIILALTGAYERRSLGGSTRTSDIDFLVEEADKLGFEIVNGTDLDEPATV